MKDKILLIDGDQLVYRVGFSCEGKCYFIDGSDIPYKKKADAIYDIGDDPTMSVGISEQEVVKPESDQRIELNRRIEKLINPYKGYLVFLSTKRNFRNEIATIRSYKDRPSRHPSSYDSLRKFLTNFHFAAVEEGLEADDLLGLNQTEDTVIYSVDKDLNMIPGWRWSKDGDFYITPEEALQSFYKQLLTGDSTDTIPGIYGIGPKKADKLIRPGMTEKTMYTVVLNEYRRNLNQLRQIQTKLPPEEVVYEIGQLLWIQQKERVQWTPPS